MSALHSVRTFGESGSNVRSGGEAAPEALAMTSAGTGTLAPRAKSDDRVTRPGVGRDCWLFRVLGLATPRQVPWSLAPGMLSLAVFADLLTLAESEAAGRAYAAYAGIYIVAAIIWLLGVRATPTRPMGHRGRRGMPARKRPHPVRPRGA